MGGERPDARKARKALAASRKELERLGCFQALFFEKKTLFRA
jgi:hypothetical protein